MRLRSRLSSAGRDARLYGWTRDTLPAGGRTPRQDEHVRPPPDCLPSATSRRWHSRRIWDPLGYLRVRSLSNPSWQRDTDWLGRYLRRDMEALDNNTTVRPVVANERAFYQAIIKRVRAYPRASSGADDADAAWDGILETIDALLTARQAAHVEALRAVTVETD